MEEQQSFDEFFRESLADYRETPPPAAWDMVAQRLDEDDRKRRRGFFYWPWTVLSMILLIGAAWWLYGWFRPGDTGTSDAGAAPRSAYIPQAEAAPAVATAGNPEHGPATETVSGNANQINSKIPAAAQQPSGSAAANGTQAADQYDPPTKVNGGSSARMSYPSSASQQVTTPAPRGITPAVITGAVNYDAGVRSRRSGNTVAQRVPASPSASQPLAIAPVPGPAANPAPPITASRQSGLLTAQTVPSNVPLPVTPLQLQASTFATVPQQMQLAGAAPQQVAGPAPSTAAQDPLALPVAVPSANDDIALTSPVPASPMPRPQALLAALEPVMHLFSGAALPPVLNIYESGLLDPNNYYPPLAPAPVVAVASPAFSDAAAPLLPADSTVREARSAFSLGGFFGYERGIKVPPRNMFSLGLSLLWQLNDRISVGMQPALLYGAVPRTALTTDQAYQRSATDVIRFTTRDYSPSILGQIDTVNNYVIREAYDSIRVRGTYLRGSMWQLELPLILQLNPFGRAFRMYGGPSLHIGGSMRIRSEGQTEIYHFDRRDSIVQSERMSEEQIKNYFGRSGLPSYITYNPDLHSFQALDPVRLGYQFGVGYERNRLNFDLSVRQQLTGYHQLSSELRQIYSGPVFRLSLGYKLIPQRVRPTSPKP